MRLYLILRQLHKKMEKPNNNASYQDMKGSSTKKVQEKININIDQNTIIKENKQYNETIKQEEQQRIVKKGIKQKYVRAPEQDSPYATKFEPAECEPFDLKGAIPLPAEEGTMIILDGSFVHFSAENTSSLPRHAYTLHVVESDGCEYPESNWLQLPKGKSFTKLYDEEQFFLKKFAF